MTERNFQNPQNGLIDQNGAESTNGTVEFTGRFYSCQTAQTVVNSQRKTFERNEHTDVNRTGRV